MKLLLEFYIHKFASLLLSTKKTAFKISSFRKRNTDCLVEIVNECQVFRLF